MTIMSETMPPDGVEALQIWVSEIGECRTTKPIGGPWPFFMIDPGMPGTDDGLTLYGVYTVHSFAVAANGVSALKNASDASRLADRRIKAFGPGPIVTVPQRSVTLANGQVVAPDLVKTKVAPHWVRYVEDASVERFVAEYDIAWRFVAAV